MNPDRDKYNLDRPSSSIYYDFPVSTERETHLNQSII